MEWVGRHGHSFNFDPAARGHLFFSSLPGAVLLIFLAESTFSGKVRDSMARSEWVSDENMQLLLAALMPANRLAIEVSLSTGLRISDVLSITLDQARKGRFTVIEAKTGKGRRVRLPAKLQRQMISMSGPIYCFSNRLDGKRHRSRSAVYKDVVRAARAFRLTAHITPHSARKIYAVHQMDRTGGDVGKVRDLLNHDRDITTLVYALSREMTERAHKVARRGEGQQARSQWGADTKGQYQALPGGGVQGKSRGRQTADQSVQRERARRERAPTSPRPAQTPATTTRKRAAKGNLPNP